LSIYPIGSQELQCVEIAEYFANEQSNKSIINRIERARKDYPACGKMPHGRNFNKETGEWNIDKEKKNKIEEIAKVYLEEDIGWAKLGHRFGMDKSFLYETLIKQSGDTWEQRFRKESLNIDERFIAKVPPLLDSETIKRIKKKSKARRS
jgi:hypothetical protein